MKSIERCSSQFLTFLVDTALVAFGARCGSARLSGKCRLLLLGLGGALLGACGSTPVDFVPSQDGEQKLQSNVALDGSDLPDHVVSLTFDDGPGPNTVPLAEYLRGEGIQATFFVIGRKGAENATTLARVRDLGHLIANHTQTHTPLTTSPDRVTEVGAADRVIQPFVTDNMFFLRAPQGKWNASVAANLTSAGLGRYVGHVHWTAGGTFSSQTSMDWDCWKSGRSVPECGRGYLNEIATVRRGVVLMHDDRDSTFALVRWLVPRLKARGYGFARLDASPAIAASVRAAGGHPSAVAASPKKPALPPAPASASPFELASLTAQGALQDEGISGGSPLCNALSQGRIDAKIVADAAVYGRRVNESLVDRSYLAALGDQLNALCD